MTVSAVEFRNVSKRFRLGQRHESLRDLLIAGLHRLLQRPRNPSESIWAVSDVDFRVNTGEALGIIGPNGAGKSTILKLLAGILRPDRGTIGVRGRLTALIEVGAGFHGDLTGRENIFLNGAILGMSRAETRAKLEAIVEFSGIDRFLDEPVKRYSSGMYARLGFSIAAHVDPDVLLVDEVLSVGDAVFRLRCLERMRGLLEQGTTLIFVTHNLDQMQAICGRALVLEAGRCAFDGSSLGAVTHYLTAMSRGYAARPTDLPDDGAAHVVVSHPHLRFLDADGEEVMWVRGSQPLRAELCFQLHRSVPQLVVELNVRTSPQENVLSFNSGRTGRHFDLERGEHAISLSVPGLPLCGGQYFWNVKMWDADRGVTILDTPMRYPMVVDDGGLATGRFVVEHDWNWRAADFSPRGDSFPGESFPGESARTEVRGSLCANEHAP